jgi:hypothetical protein
MSPSWLGADERHAMTVIAVTFTLQSRNTDRSPTLGGWHCFGVVLSSGLPYDRMFMQLACAEPEQRRHLYPILAPQREYGDDKSVIWIPV